MLSRILQRIPRMGTFVNGDQVVKLKDVESVLKEELCSCGSAMSDPAEKKMGACLACTAQWPKDPKTKQPTRPGNEWWLGDEWRVHERA